MINKKQSIATHPPTTIDTKELKSIPLPLKHKKLKKLPRDNHVDKTISNLHFLGNSVPYQDLIKVFSKQELSEYLGCSMAVIDRYRRGDSNGTNVVRSLSNLLLYFTSISGKTFFDDQVLPRYKKLVGNTEEQLAVIDKLRSASIGAIEVERKLNIHRRFLMPSGDQPLRRPYAMLYAIADCLYDRISNEGHDDNQCKELIFSFIENAYKAGNEPKHKPKNIWSKLSDFQFQNVF